MNVNILDQDFMSEITCNDPDCQIDLMCVELVVFFLLYGQAVRLVSFIIATLQTPVRV